VVQAIDLDVEDVVERRRDDVTGKERQRARQVLPAQALQVSVHRRPEQEEADEQRGGAVAKHGDGKPQMAHLIDIDLSGQMVMRVRMNTSHTTW
jgi:hypothetical protein